MNLNVNGVWYCLLCIAFSACQFTQPPAFIGKNAIVSIEDVDTQLPVFQKIQEAIDSAPANGETWSIVILPGEYNERVVINRDNVTLLGQGKIKPRIVYGRYAGQKVHAHSEETWGTFRTATLEINGKDISLVNLRVENSFDYPANERLAINAPNKVRGEQAVALKIGKRADRTIISNSQLLGYQDTLYVNGGRSYFKGGEIHGHVDFIFGNGNALFDGVDIISRARTKKVEHSGFITAPSTLLYNEYGFTFVACRLLRENGVAEDSVPLGRPWHPTTTFSDGRYANPNAVGKSVFINTFMDAHISHDGWTTMGGTLKDGTRKQFDPINDARFYEYKSFGPGAKVNDSRPQLMPDQVEQYRINTILEGWGKRVNSIDF
ncbi:MAG: pectinesterase family protein [Paraglaciecola sp.]|uniref:pectinesterase family protein n=1 Tax=Paraglaciecola sp. TaxID=1920173 RepID=UPI003297268C